MKTQKTPYGSLKAKIAGPVNFDAPNLGNWKVQDSLPERWLNYSDTGAAWVDADHYTTVNPLKTATLPYLYVDEYGFHAGVHLWRGYFNGTPTAVYLNVQGGIAHGWSAFLNGKFIGSFLGDVHSAAGNKTLSFPEDTLLESGTNVLLIIQDNTGHDEGSASINPRGILNATLIGSSSSFSSWKVAGTAGGSSNTIVDPVRTYYNEGGLTAERLGWHLPDFDDSDWPAGSPSEGFMGAGVKFYRSPVTLNTPEGHDVALSLKFSYDTTRVATFRALVYVNGYQYGRFYPNLNAVGTFPVPPGIWKYDGQNLVGVALWAQSEDGAKVDLDIQVNYVVESSLNVKFDGDYLRPGWDADRMKYA